MPASAEDVHSGALLHPRAAQVRILGGGAGHAFRHRRWEHLPRFGPGRHGITEIHVWRPHRRHHAHSLGWRPHHGGGGALHAEEVVFRFFCGRCDLHFDHVRAFRRHAWHHHGIRRHELFEIAIHWDGVTILPF